MKHLVRRIRKNNLPMFIEHNNTLITDPNIISNTFNDYFAKYWIRFSVKYMCRRKTMKCINNICLRSRNVFANLRKYTKMTFWKLLIKWTTRVVQVMTCFLNKILKAIKNEISKPLTLIINQMLETGIFSR